MGSLSGEMGVFMLLWVNLYNIYAISLMFLYMYTDEGVKQFHLRLSNEKNFDTNYQQCENIVVDDKSFDFGIDDDNFDDNNQNNNGGGNKPRLKDTEGKW